MKKDIQQNNVYFIDPINSTTYYNFCLVSAIQKFYSNFHFLTAKFIYDTTLSPPSGIKYYFFHLTSFLSKSIKLNPTIRRLLRGLEYPLDLLFIYYKIWMEKITVVHYNYFVFPHVELYFIKLCKLKRCRIIITAHNPLPHDSGDRYTDIYKRIYHSADLVITLTRYVKEVLVNSLNVSREKINVIPHGDMNFIFNQVKTEKGIIYSKKVIALVGSISPYKGLMFLLDVFKLLLEKIDIYLLIIGIPNEPIQKYYDRAINLKIEQNIIWDIGYQPLSDMYKKIKNVSMMIFPYERASQSGGIITAFTLNKPVIIRAVGGLAEMIDEGKDGLVSDTADMMAESIFDILSDRKKFQEMQKYIRNERQLKNDWNQICRSFITIYKNESI